MAVVIFLFAVMVQDDALNYFPAGIYLSDKSAIVENNRQVISKIDVSVQSARRP